MWTLSLTTCVHHCPRDEPQGCFNGNARAADKWRATVRRQINKTRPEIRSVGRLAACYHAGSNFHTLHFKRLKLWACVCVCVRVCTCESGTTNKIDCSWSLWRSINILLALLSGHCDSDRWPFFFLAAYDVGEGDVFKLIWLFNSLGCESVWIIEPAQSLWS